MSDFRRMLIANQTREYTGYPLVISRSVALRYLKQYQIYGNSEQGVPAGYTPLEYIESTGTQYIDTGIYSTDVIETMVVGQYTELSGSSSIFGVLESNGKNYYGLGLASGTEWRLWYGSGGHPWVIFGTPDTNKHTFLLKNKSIYIDNLDTPIAESDLSCSSQTKTMFLFGANFGGKLYTPSKAKIFSAVIKDNNSLVRNLIPAKNSSGVVGMYDTVSGTFFTNAGTGEFIAGNPVVLDSCRNLFDKTTVTANRYIAPSGSITSDGTNRTVVSGEIYVKPSTTYTLSSVGNIYDASYNRSGFQYQADGTPISAITATQNTGIVTFTTDANCAYVRVMSVTANVDTAMLEEGSTATEYVPYCAPEIKIATTAYNAARFSPVQTDLNNAVATIREIVTKTINQTAAIASLQADKQTRPEDACPAGKKCLLVETEENGVIVPHWFPIIEAPE